MEEKNIDIYKSSIAPEEIEIVSRCCWCKWEKKLAYSKVCIGLPSGGEVNQNSMNPKGQCGYYQDSNFTTLIKFFGGRKSKKIKVSEIKIRPK